MSGLLLFVVMLTGDGPQAEAVPLSVPEKLTVAGLERSYLLFVPSRKPSGPVPLVFVFHGEGNEGRVAEAYFEMNKVAEEKGFITVYPDGLDRSWDDGRDVAPGGTRNLDDVAFTRAILEDVASKHPIDRTQVFATGMSTGGMFCHRLAAEASDIFAAIAPIAGPIPVPLAKEFKLVRPISLLVIQGDADPIIPLDGGFVYPRGIHRRGEITSLKETVGRYLVAAEVTGEPREVELEDRVEDGTTTRQTVYPAGRDGTRIVVDLVKGGGHNLPGRKPDFPEWAVGKAGQDFDGAMAIWDFFASCPPRDSSD